MKRTLSPAGTSLVFAIFIRGYEVVPDFLSKRKALNRPRGKSTNAPEKTIRALRNLLLVVSLAVSPLRDDDFFTSREFLREDTKPIYYLSAN